jgi:hypothetical protein
MFGGEEPERSGLLRIAKPEDIPPDRGRRLRPDADGAGLVEVGAVGGDAAAVNIGRSMGCHLAATLTRRSAMKVRHRVDSGPSGLMSQRRGSAVSSRSAQCSKSVGF